MQSIKNILTKFNPTKDKYISREFQKYGYDLSEELGDYKHASLYIKLAKSVPRPILEKARNFVKDAQNVQSKPRLFMWKIGLLKKEWKEKQLLRTQSEAIAKPRSSSLKRVHLLISGDVIGVGFRYFVYSNALKLKITGWVFNTPFKKVEVLMEGERESLENMVTVCTKGPAASKITDVFRENSPYSGEFSSFTIRKI